jgi:predicted MFS family arabinose efflux permease
VLLTARFFLASLIAVQVLAYYLGGIFAPMVIIVSIWGMIHTGGFLVSNIRTTQSIPHHALEFVNSLLTSSFNIGISLGAFLGGIISAYYGVHYVLWVSVLLLAVTFAMSFVTFPKTQTEDEESIATKFAPSVCKQA